VSRAYFSCIIPAPVEAVWDVLADFHGISDWMDRVVSVTPEDGSDRGAVGSIRRLTLKDGRVVGERLVAYDAVARSYTYEFAPGAFPFPVRSYAATVHVLPVTSDDTTFLEWFGEYDSEYGSDGDVEAELGETFIGRYREFANDLTTYLAAATTAAQSNAG
jgi:Polyketide cyclase / dehydrase and lipid transport